MGKFVKRLLIVLAVLFGIAVLACAGTAGAYYYLQTAPVKAEEIQGENAESKEAGAEAVSEYILKIPTGTSIKDVAAELYGAGIIRDEKIFYLKARLENLAMKAGRYTVRPTMNLDEIFSLLTAGHEEHISVSIPEGLTISQIAALLEKSDVILSAEDFIKRCKSEEFLTKYNIPGRSLEGYLFPDTYFFTPSMDADLVIERLVDNFFVRIENLGIEAANAQDLHETVILASIVEREYRRPEEAPLIASVFANRLKYHIGLESCATIVYILTEIEGRPHPDRITYEDLKIDSDYNTYKWAGLPAGPISNPGAIALQAAANPAKTNYYYFRVKDEAAGSHYFSSSLQEHAKAGRDLSVKKAAGK